MTGRRLLTAATVLLVSASVGTAVRAKDGDKDKANAVQHAIVDFAQPFPQDSPAAKTHFLKPVGGEKDGEVTVFKGGTVTFRVNGGGHGVSVYRVSRNTTREDIVAAGSGRGLCDTRSNCAATFINGPHVLMDGDGNVILEVGTNTASPRMEDPDRILVGTAAAVPGVDPDGKPILDANGNQTIVAGIFQAGVNCLENGTPNCATLRPPAQTVNTARPIGEHIRVKFTKNGRYLVICMNRNHSINDHMFSFVNVVGDDDN